ncbi:transglycosylase SLT domain-containing protein [Litchfieldella rifensis]|uniref:Transglycosylase SLT domain-containing protein n=1 Tax=Litchfieldella rifensis TaxID=762643 RepID=A0ABV7LRW2_9GAMM
MTYRTTRRQVISLAGALLLTTLGLEAAAQAKIGDTMVSRLTATTEPSDFWQALILEPAPLNAWTRLRDAFQWQSDTDKPRVQEWIEHYRSSPENIAEITERARPWLHWILEQLEARDLPGEIALLPFIESSFAPTARSPHGASGLWQFMPGTADALGLSRSRGYDGRLDVVASTRAALDYLEQQAEQWYDGDMELSLAAYNAGAGTVNKARHAAAHRGEPDDYWHLRLPGETMHYVPKLLAISAIVAEPEKHGVELADIANRPAFATVELDGPLSLNRAASLAGTTRAELEALNPGLLNGSLSPSNSSVLLVPVEHHDTLMANLESWSPAERAVAEDTYVVQRGDNLSTIAALHGVTLTLIRDLNGLDGDLIYEGQTLNIPRPTLAQAQASSG